MASGARSGALLAAIRSAPGVDRCRARAARHEHRDAPAGRRGGADGRRVAGDRAAGARQAAVERRSELERRLRGRSEVEAVAAARAPLETDESRARQSGPSAFDLRRSARARPTEAPGGGAPAPRARCGGRAGSSASVEAAKDALVEALGDEARLRNLGEALERRRARAARAAPAARRGAARARRAARRERARARARAGGAPASARDERDARERRSATASCGARVRSGRRGAQASSGVERRARRCHAAASRAGLAARAAGALRGVHARDGQPARRAPTGGQLLADVLRVPAELERAVAAALGAAAAAGRRADDTTDAVDAIRWLVADEARHGDGAPERPGAARAGDRAGRPPARRRARGRSAALGARRGRCSATCSWRTTSTPRSRSGARRAHPVTVVTLAGEAIDPLGAVTGGSEAPLEETLLARGARAARASRSARRASARARARGDGARLEAVRAARARRRRARSRRSTSGCRRCASPRWPPSKDRERLEDERTRIAAELEVGALEASGLAGADGEVSGELRRDGSARARTRRVGVERRARAARRRASVRSAAGASEIAQRGARTTRSVAVRRDAGRGTPARGRGGAEAITSARRADLSERLAETEALAVEGGEAIATGDAAITVGAECARARRRRRAPGRSARNAAPGRRRSAEADAALSAEDREERAARERRSRRCATRRVDVERVADRAAVRDRRASASACSSATASALEALRRPWRRTRGLVEDERGAPCRGDPCAHRAPGRRQPGRDGRATTRSGSATSS